MLYDTNNKSLCSLEICPHFNSYDIWTVGLWVTFILYMFLCFSYMNRKEYIMALSHIFLAPNLEEFFSEFIGELQHACFSIVVEFTSYSVFCKMQH